MKKVFDTLAAALRQGDAAALCTILGVTGSAPRGAGAKMVVLPDGSTVGTVGGGTVELRTAELALQALRTGKSVLHGFRLNQNQVEDLGMICGGGVTIYIQVFSPGDPAALAFVDDVCSLLERPENAWLIYQLEDGQVTQMGTYTKEAGLRHMLLDEQELTSLLTSQPTYQDGSPAFYAEPLVLSGTVYLFGGGHVGAALVPVLAYVGFRVAVFDNRADFASREHYPKAERVIFGDYRDFSPQVTLRPEDYVAIMTPGHQADREVLLQALRSPASYIGLIGSRSKLAATKAWLLERGIPEEDWARVHAPIGLPLGGRTPEEIAISIAAEMIRHRAEHFGNRR